MLDPRNLRSSLARHLGQTLTPELASQIEIEAGVQSSDWLNFHNLVEPQVWGDYMFAAEDVEPIAGQICDMAGQMSAELSSVTRPKAPSQFDLMALQSRGQITFTIRKGGDLIGMCFVAPVRDGCSDAGMYILPNHRGGMASMRFVKYIEEQVRLLGARWMLWECDAKSRTQLMAKRMCHPLISQRFLAKFSEGE
jgi:hypothetical protein